MMSNPLAGQIAQRLVSSGTPDGGICLVLGAADTGKTTLVEALANELVAKCPVGIVDADTGQSHIGPPGTVGWAVAEESACEISKLPLGGISFVGDITPVGHLLGLTAAIVQCVGQASQLAPLIVVDTPGFISGSAAAALWWEVHRILQPKMILAIQRSGELGDILNGLRNSETQIELLSCPSGVRPKSPEQRRAYRQDKFAEYFRNGRVYDISLSKLAVQAGDRCDAACASGRLVALRGGKGADLAVGAIVDWRQGGDTITVKAPIIDITSVRCLVIGSVSVDLPVPSV